MEMSLCRASTGTAITSSTELAAYKKFLRTVLTWAKKNLVFVLASIFLTLAGANPAIAALRVVAGTNYDTPGLNFTREGVRTTACDATVTEPISGLRTYQTLRSDDGEFVECNNFYSRLTNAGWSDWSWGGYGIARYVWVCIWDRDPRQYITVDKDAACPNDAKLTLTSSFMEIRPASTGGNSAAQLIAKVVEGTAPKAGVAVSFTVDVTANSGGHDHDNATRPKGKLSVAQGTTDANGEVKVTFTAPAIAGIHTIKATCANCTSSPASKEIKVKVPDLVEMPPDTKVPPSYTLVGQTANHASNHWFLPKSRDTLARVVDTMVKTGWGTVGINDGSLMWGGLFDIKGGWSPSHSEHRTGNEVDISVTNPGLVSAAKKKSTYAELCKKENTAFSLQTLWHVDDGYPEHFHMYLDGTGLTSQAGGGPCCARYKTTRAKNDTNGNPVLDTGGNPVQETVALCEETSPR